MKTRGDMLRFAIAFALMRARKLVRGLRQGLSEDERYLIADDVVHRLQQHGDPWDLSRELPPMTGKRGIRRHQWTKDRTFVCFVPKAIRQLRTECSDGPNSDISA